MHKHTENESSPSSFSVSLSLSLSVSLSLCHCFREVLWSCCCGVLWCCVLCCGVVCVRCGVWCVVYGVRQTCFNMCAWSRHTRGRAEWTHGERGGEGREGVVVSLVFSSVKQMFFDILEHLNRMLGSSLIANFLLTPNLPTYGLSRASEVYQRTLGSYKY